MPIDNGNKAKGKEGNMGHGGGEKSKGVFPFKPKNGSVFPKEQKSVKAMACNKLGKAFASPFSEDKKDIHPKG